MKDEKLRKANIFYNDNFVGVLEEIPSGYKFAYDEKYLLHKEAVAISITLPLRKEKYESDQLFSFFKGLLSEGWYKDLVCKTLKYDSEDEFGLLLATGKNTIGAVTVEGA